VTQDPVPAAAVILLQSAARHAVLQAKTIFSLKAVLHAVIQILPQEKINQKKKNTLQNQWKLMYF